MHKTAIIMGVLSALLFGAATPISKLLLEGFTPFQLAGLLYLGAALAVAPSVILKQDGFGLPPRSDRRNQIRLLGAVIFGGVIGPVLLLFGLHQAEATSVALWLNLELAATAVLGALIFKDHLGPRGWLGVAIALFASVLLVWAPGSSGYLAVVLVLLACFCWGLDNHLTALVDGITPSQSTLWKGVVAGTVNLAIGIYLDPFSIRFLPIVMALLVGSLAYGASIVFYIRSAQLIGAIRAQVLFASAPFFGILLAVVILNEPLTLVHLLATPIFLIGVTLLLLERHSHHHFHEAMTHQHLHSHNDGHHTHEHAGLPSSVRHIHPHTHVPIEHQHPHWPDIHHRHRHK